MSAADTAGMVRIYFDNSHWNNLLHHPNREEFLHGFDRQRRAVLPSVVNAAELLNTPDSDRRRQLCETMSALLDARHTVLDHADFVLKATADAVRQGEESVVLTESGAAQALRGWIARPDRFGEEQKAAVRAWTDKLDRQTEDFRRDLDGIIGDVGFLGDARTLTGRADFASLLFAKVAAVAEAAQSTEEVADLVRRCPVWAAFAGSIAYEFSIQVAAPHRATRPRPPEGSDMFQIIYLGLVEVFVTDDRRFRNVVQWVAGMLPDGVSVDVLSTEEYFEAAGYPYVVSSPK